MAPISRLEKFLNLPAAERRLLLGCWWRLLVAHARLRYAPRRRLRILLNDATASRFAAAGPGVLSHARRQMLALGQAANHHVVAANCLTRSLAGYDLLRRQGLEPTLRIGVLFDDTRTLRAHAWLELAGEVLNDRPDVASRFTPLLDTSQMIRDVRDWV